MKLALRSSEAALTGLAVAGAGGILGLIFWSFDSTDPMWAIISFVLVFDPDVRVARTAALSRLALTVLGSAIAMAFVLAFGLHKWLLPLSVAMTAGVCGLFLRSRGSWRIVLVTVALIVGSSLLQPSLGSYIAVVRSIEVSSGSLLAVAFSWMVARFQAR